MGGYRVGIAIIDNLAKNLAKEFGEKMFTLTVPSPDQPRGVNRYFAERVKDLAQIEDVVSDFITLRRKGSTLTGLCPFHDDTHDGNFVVSPRRNICKCFACGGRAMGPVDFVMAITKCDYPAAIRYLARKYGMLEGAQGAAPATAYVRPRKKNLELFHFSQKEKPRAAMDLDATAAANASNNLWKFLYNVMRTDAMRRRLAEVWNAYRVETATGALAYYTAGWTAFPFVDMEGRYLNAKFMRYGTDGHRFRPQEGGDNSPYIAWLANLKKIDNDALKKEGKRLGRCFFGSHLIPQHPRANLCLVESEKTAIIAQCFADMDDLLFIASGGKQGAFTAEMLRPIIREGRDIWLYADTDAVTDWYRKSVDINKKLEMCSMVARIRQSRAMLDRWDLYADGPKSDIADVLLRQWRTRCERVH